MANIGLLIGLLFVGIEVRNSSSAVAAQTADSIADGFNTFDFMIASDPDIARIFYLGMNNPDRLTDLEALRFSFLMFGHFNHYHRVYTLYQSGLISESRWSGTAKEISSISQTPGRRLLLGGITLPDGLQDEIDRYLGNQSSGNITLGRKSLDIE